MGGPTRLLDHADNRGRFKVSYRHFLQDQSCFHQMLDTPDEQVAHKVHLTYRLNYLKESVMAYYLYIEDPTYNFISHVIAQNNQKILEALLSTHQAAFVRFLAQLCSDLHRSVSFLLEFYLTFRQFFFQIVTQPRAIPPSRK